MVLLGWDTTGGLAFQEEKLKIIGSKSPLQSCLGLARATALGATRRVTPTVLKLGIPLALKLAELTALKLAGF